MSKFYNTVLVIQDNMSLEDSYLNALEASVAMETAYDILDSGYIVTEGFVDKAKNAFIWVWDKLKELVNKAWEFIKRAKDRAVAWIKKHTGSSKAEAAEAPKGDQKAQPAPGMKVNAAVKKEEAPVAAGTGSASSSQSSTSASGSETQKRQETPFSYEGFTDKAMELFPSIVSKVIAKFNELTEMIKADKDSSEYTDFMKAVEDNEKSNNKYAIFNIIGKGTDSQLEEIFTKSTQTVSDRKKQLDRLNQYESILKKLKDDVSKLTEKCKSAATKLSNSKNVKMKKIGSVYKIFNSKISSLLSGLVNGMIADTNNIIKAFNSK